MSYLPNEQGAILYVSKSGNNDHAVKGDKNRPWSDPWAAFADSQAGDLIWIFPGTYTFGETSSGADHEYNPAAIIEASLCNDYNISYYFEPGAKILRTGSVTAYASLFGSALASDFTLNIYGHGEIDLDMNIASAPTYEENVRLFGFWAANKLNIHCELNRLDNCGSNYTVCNTDYIYVHIKEYTQPAYVYSLAYIGADSPANWDATARSSYTFKFDKLIYGVPALESPNTADNSGIKLGHIDGGSINVHIGDAKIYGKGTNALLTSYGSTRDILNTRLHYRVDNLYREDPYIANGSYSAYILDETIATDEDDGYATARFMSPIFKILGNQNDFIGNTFLFEIGNAQIDGPLTHAAPWSSAASVDNTIVFKVGNVVSLNNSPIIVNATHSLQSYTYDDSNVMIFEIGYGYNPAGPVVIEILKGNHIIIRNSRLVSGGTNSVITYTDDNNSREPMKIINSELINDGITDVIAPITATTTRDIVILGSVYTNGGSVSADVTQVVENITSSANIV